MYNIASLSIKLIMVTRMHPPASHQPLSRSPAAPQTVSESPLGSDSPASGVWFSEAPPPCRKICLQYCQPHYPPWAWDRGICSHCCEPNTSHPHKRMEGLKNWWRAFWELRRPWLKLSSMLFVRIKRAERDVWGELSQGFIEVSMGTETGCWNGTWFHLFNTCFVFC